MKHKNSNCDELQTLFSHFNPWEIIVSTGSVYSDLGYAYGRFLQVSGVKIGKLQQY